MNILILEDNKFILSIIQAALKSHEGQTYLANDQFEAEKMYGELKPEIVISDLHMEVGTSWDFLANVSKDLNTKVLVVSSDFELLTKVEEDLAHEEWRFVSKNNRKWLLLIKEHVDSFFSGSKINEAL